MADVFASTPYDDVFRTLLNVCTNLILPVINELFGEHYTGEERIAFGPNEHFLERQDEERKILHLYLENVPRTRGDHCQDEYDSGDGQPEEGRIEHRQASIDKVAYGYGHQRGQQHR